MVFCLFRNKRKTCQQQQQQQPTTDGVDSNRSIRNCYKNKSTSLSSKRSHKRLIQDASTAALTAAASTGDISSSSSSEEESSSSNRSFKGKASSDIIIRKNSTTTIAPPSPFIESFTGISNGRKDNDQDDSIFTPKGAAHVSTSSKFTFWGRRKRIKKKKNTTTKRENKSSNKKGSMASSRSSIVADTSTIGWVRLDDDDDDDDDVMFHDAIGSDYDYKMDNTISKKTEKTPLEQEKIQSNVYSDEITTIKNEVVQDIDNRTIEENKSSRTLSELLAELEQAEQELLGNKRNSSQRELNEYCALQEQEGRQEPSPSPLDDAYINNNVSTSTSLSMILDTKAPEEEIVFLDNDDDEVDDEDVEFEEEEEELCSNNNVIGANDDIDARIDDDDDIISDIKQQPIVSLECITPHKIEVELKQHQLDDQTEEDIYKKNRFRLSPSFKEILCLSSTKDNSFADNTVDGSSMGNVSDVSSLTGVEERHTAQLAVVLSPKTKYDNDHPSMEYRLNAVETSNYMIAMGQEILKQLIPSSSSFADQAKQPYSQNFDHAKNGQERSASSLSSSMKCLMLLMDPRQRIFEVVPAFVTTSNGQDSSPLLIGDLLAQILYSATDFRLKFQEYTGLAYQGMFFSADQRIPAGLLLDPAKQQHGDEVQSSSYNQPPLFIVPRGFTAEQIELFGTALLDNPKVIRMIQDHKALLGIPTGEEI